MLRYPDVPFDEQMQWSQRVINYGGSWRAKTNYYPRPAELSLLSNLRDYRAEVSQSGSEDIKMRIEDPLIQVYAKDLKILEEFASVAFHNVPNIDSMLDSITVPKNNHDLKLLQQGYVLRSHSDYACKINLRDGKYNLGVRTSLLNYLDALGSDVSIPNNTRQQLEKSRGDFIWGAYFYCMDEDIKLMIGMIDPRLIRSIDRYHSTAK